MPKTIIRVLLVLAAASLIPMGMLYKARTERGRQETRLQVVHDMDDQFHFRTQSANPFFADGRAMRLPPAGTVARGGLRDDDPFHFGRVEGDTLFVAELPLTVDMALLDRGQERFEIFCAVCHGLTGQGDGLVNRRAVSLAEGTWTPASDLTAAAIVERPAGHIYNTITGGLRGMPAYGADLTPRDRWAVVAYVRALQRARNGSIEDVPAAARGGLSE